MSIPTFDPYIEATIERKRIGYRVKRGGLGIPERMYSWHPTLRLAKRAARRWIRGSDEATVVATYRA